MDKQSRNSQELAFETAVAHITDTSHDPLQAFYDVLRVHVAAHMIELKRIFDITESIVQKKSGGRLCLHDDFRFSSDIEQWQDAWADLETLHAALGGQDNGAADMTTQLKGVAFEGDGLFSWIGLTGLVRDLTEHLSGGYDAGVIALDMVQAAAGAFAKSGATVASIVEAMAQDPVFAESTQQLQPDIDHIHAGQVDARVAISICGHLTRELGREHMPEFPQAEQGFSMANVATDAASHYKTGQRPIARLG